MFSLTKGLIPSSAMRKGFSLLTAEVSAVVGGKDVEYHTEAGVCHSGAYAAFNLIKRAASSNYRGQASIIPMVD